MTDRVSPEAARHLAVSSHEAHPDASLCVHGGRQDLRALGVHVAPLDLSTTYPISSLAAGTESLDRWVEGGEGQEPVYARLHQPTVARWEAAVAALEGAEEAVAFGSGMAAVTACLLASAGERANVVAVRPLYGGTDHLLGTGWFGFENRWATEETVSEVVDENTTLVVVETPANPTLDLVDLERLCRRVAPCPVLVDSTFATPILQKPLLLGARLSLHSATKYLGGHGDVMAGIVATDAEMAARLRQVRILTGALLSPFAAHQLLRSLSTLEVRVLRAQATASQLAERLGRHPLVTSLAYPDLSREPWLRRQMKGPGAMIAFELAGGFEAAAAVLRGVEMITPAVSLGSCDTLIQHPAGLTHRVVSETDRTAHGISPGLLRLSVGLEAVEDLWADLERAFHRAATEAVREAPTGSLQRRSDNAPSEVEPAL